METTTPKSLKNEWSTPSIYIEAARSVMASIDLDPATNERAQAIIKATIFYTAETNGLQHEWHGRVWLNPPYSNGLMQQFIKKFLDEFEAGRILEAIVLTHNNTDTAWWQSLANKCAAVCFPRGRIAFDDGSGRSNPTQGQSFFYFNQYDNDFDLFCGIFKKFGTVLSWE